jgi:hypothetical protein
MTNGVASGTAALSITTTGTGALAMHRGLPAGKGWIGAGGAVLALLVFLGFPARRQSWRSMLGILVLLATLGGLTACGSGGGTAPAGTTLGPYTITVTGTGNDPSSTTASTTFVVTVN